ncbi:hypothetical protein BX666DRAFT_1927696 [Dichotomocladium elegans]|nr:hypothetical protein BX666DRAFT_1927696 [Dichotomocladium elegans]
MVFWSRNQNDSPSAPPPTYTQNCYNDGAQFAERYPPPPGNAYTQSNSFGATSGQDAEERQPLATQKYAPREQNEDVPTDLGDLQDIFSFEFMRGRPIWNFFLAILWCIGLPILLYHILRPYLGQVIAMVVASAPPLLIVILRMVRERTFDMLGVVAGVSFLISGIISISEPDDKVASICESLVPLLVGILCVVSVIPIRIGRWKMRPLIYELANQIMPRTDSDEALAANDDMHLAQKRPASKRQKLDWAYRNLARFRRDMRVMTFSWGVMLIAGFIIKLIIVLTEYDTAKAELAGFLIFGLGAFFLTCFTWFYTKICRGHIKSDLAFWRENNEPRPLDGRSEAIQNVNWGMQSMGNVWGQAIG